MKIHAIIVQAIMRSDLSYCVFLSFLQHNFLWKSKIQDPNSQDYEKRSMKHIFKMWASVNPHGIITNSLSNQAEIAVHFYKKTSLLIQVMNGSNLSTTKKTRTRMKIKSLIPDSWKISYHQIHSKRSCLKREQINEKKNEAEMLTD